MRAVDRHTGGHVHDDMALLLLEHGAPPCSSANGHTAAALPRRALSRHLSPWQLRGRAAALPGRAFAGSAPQAPQDGQRAHGQPAG